MHCTYPYHNDERVTKAELCVNPTVVKEVWLKTRDVMPYGSGITI